LENIVTTKIDLPGPPTPSAVPRIFCSLDFQINGDRNTYPQKETKSWEQNIEWKKKFPGMLINYHLMYKN